MENERFELEKPERVEKAERFERIRSEKAEKAENNGWCTEHETLLSEWADKAMCYKWLHMKSNEKYQFLHNIYTIPVIIMSTLTGTANFAQEKLPENYAFYAPIVIGSINILAGIITTIQQFLHITELNESHRVSTISWDKFHRRLKNELSKNPAERDSINEFLLTATEEYDRLIESSPVIDKGIITLFKTTFDGTFTNTDVKAMFKELSKPDILDALIPVKNSIYKPAEKLLKERVIRHFKDEFTYSEEKRDSDSMKIISDFAERFSMELSRLPTRKELIDNLIEFPVDEDMIDRYLSSLEDV